VISDVIRDDLESIASGPVHPDSTTFETARGILKKYHLWEDAPPKVQKAIMEGIEGRMPETLKKNDPVIERVSTAIVGNIRSALEGAAVAAGKLGFRAHILTTSDHGEAREAARQYVALLRSIAASPRLSSPSPSPSRLSPPRAGLLRFGVGPLCLLAGGELTVTVRGNGHGGRNTEFVLAALNELRREPLGSGRDWLIASVGTDGIDGPTDAAGAMITPAAFDAAERLALDPASYLDNNDSYTFFEKAGGLVRTGPTGTNVMDLRIFLLKF
jgi:glycerate 2-kinase